MPIRLIPEPTFEHDVEITEPGVDKPEKLKFIFKAKTRDEAAKFFQAIEKGEVGERDDVQVLMDEVVAGWGLADEFNAENFRIFLQHHIPAPVEILHGYRAGLMDSRAKN